MGGSWELELSCQCEEMQNQADVSECKADEPGGAAHWADMLNIFSATGQCMGAGMVTALLAGPNLYSLSEEVSRRILAS